MPVRSLSRRGSATPKSCRKKGMIGVEVEKPATASSSAAQTAWSVLFHRGAAIDAESSMVSSFGRAYQKHGQSIRRILNR